MNAALSLSSAPLAPLAPFGQDAAADIFLRQLDQDRLGHAWLLHGVKGIGKALLAQALATVALVHRPTQGSLAERLTQLAEDPLIPLIAQRACPDLFWLERKSSDKPGQKARLKAEIEVSQVADRSNRSQTSLAIFLTLSRAMAKRKVVIIDAVEDLNRSAANALLKDLEEPRPHTLFLLISHRPGQLLPTLRSRTMAMPLAPLGFDDFQRWLERAGRQPAPDASASAPEAHQEEALARAQRLYAACAGRPGYALALEDLDLLGWQGELASALDQLGSSDSPATPQEMASLLDPIIQTGDEQKRDWAMIILLDSLAARAREHAALGWVEAHSQFTQAFRDLLALRLDARLTLSRVWLDLEAAAREKQRPISSAAAPQDDHD